MDSEYFQNIGIDRVKSQFNEIIIDLFAGGGGASEGIRRILDRDPDVAVNHDEVAVAMHMANHPGTRHLIKDIWEVPPRWATGCRPVGLLWASPDCKHFSKAKGSAPARSREIRSLAWVVEKWARDVRPRIVILENVEEFSGWGPLDKYGKVIANHKGDTFRSFVRRFRRLGYAVEWRELRACDYGAPTIRRRLFLIARCDKEPIVWPEPTRGPGLVPYRTAAKIIDWSIPCPSIFERKKPLAENTLRRIAEGIRRYVINTAEPFIAPLTHQGFGRVYSINDPLKTVTAAHRGEFAIVTPHIQRQFGEGVGSSINSPIGTVMAGGMGKTAMVGAFLAKHYGGVVGHELTKPIGAVTSIDHHSLVTSNLIKLRGTCQAGQAVDAPMPTITSGGLHIGEVRAFMVKYYDRGHGQSTVMIQGEPYVIEDIGMRMLSPPGVVSRTGFYR
ncbi:MAG: DNA cytosine methyltransferase [Desulfatirhabdiaceae bacterium]